MTITDTPTGTTPPLPPSGEPRRTKGRGVTTAESAASRTSTSSGVPAEATSRSTSACAAAEPSEGQKLPLVTTPTAADGSPGLATAAPSRAARRPATASPTRMRPVDRSRRVRSAVAPGNAREPCAGVSSVTAKPRPRAKGSLVSTSSCP